MKPPGDPGPSAVVDEVLAIDEEWVVQYADFDGDFRSSRDFSVASRLYSAVLAPVSSSYSPTDEFCALVDSFPASVNRRVDSSTRTIRRVLRTP